MPSSCLDRPNVVAHSAAGHGPLAELPQPAERAAGPPARRRDGLTALVVLLALLVPTGATAVTASWSLSLGDSSATGLKGRASSYRWRIAKPRRKTGAHR
jgi:hypothetical protein